MTATRRLQLVAALVLVFVGLLPALALAQPVPRSLYVSALDQNGTPVSDLTPADVLVREDKVAREVLSIAPAEEPMHIALLVDNSKAADPYIRDYREALPAFIAAILGDERAVKHQISIITLAERPTISAEYTSDAGPLNAAAGRIFSLPDSGTYLLDGIIEVSKGIQKRNLSRPVIVAITTEGPELSDRPYQSVLEPLSASGAAFHVIVVGNPRNTSYDRSIVLDQGTREGGGRFDTLLTGNALAARMKQVGAELTHQFKITYARPDTLIPPEQVTVSSAKDGLTVRGMPVREMRQEDRR